MHSGVFVIGAGIISAIGQTREEVFNNLVAGKSGLRHSSVNIPGFSTPPIVGEVGLSNIELVNLLDLNPAKQYSRTLLLGLYAVKQAIKEAGLTSEHLANAVFISANTVGGMDVTEHISQFESNDSFESLKQHDCGASTQFIAENLGIGGYCTTINTACSSSANAIMLGARFILSGKADIVIAGGTDALCEFTLKGFNSLMLLSNEPCKPFDKLRNGLNLGEGAGFIILCSAKMVNSFTKWATLEGWANTNDAYHQTASSPDGRGAQLAMKNAMSMANLMPESISYINAHGTATPNNDLAESMAISHLFKDPPLFSSTKSYTGHTLGASGGIEAVISLIALERNMAFGSLHFNDVMDETLLKPCEQNTSINVNYVLSNSFGFGGNCTSLIFGKP